LVAIILIYGLIRDSLPTVHRILPWAEVEAELGTKLFHRLPRGVQLTDTGERFVQRARQVISDVDDLVTDIREATTALSGRLRIGVSPAGYVNYLLPELTTIAREHPEVRVETISGSAQSLCPRLLRGELNLLIGPSSYLNRWKELHVQELRKRSATSAVVWAGVLMQPDKVSSRLAATSRRQHLRALHL